MTAPASDFFQPTLDEQIACVEREIGLRKRVYPQWIQAKRMTQHKADKEIAAMEAVAATLHKLAGGAA